jgi:hypothetical protein
VATSRPGSGFWRGPVGRWLASTKNIVGCALAAVAVAAQLVVGLGALWPVIVVAAYAIGALVAPRDRVSLQLGSDAAASADALREQLAVLRRSLRGEARRLPADATALVDGILTDLDEIVGRLDELSSRPDQRHVVEQMILDYLPTTLQRYLNLPRTFALGSRVEGRRTAHEELLEQLGILQGESRRIRDAVYARDLNALGDQGRFLRDKFSRSDLDLGPA